MTDSSSGYKAAWRFGQQTWDTEPGLPIPGVSEVVLIASGKGGVGKSTVTVNLACALGRTGLSVGVIDADIYGPSVARLLGTGDSLAVDGYGRAIPAHSHGVYSVSVGNILPPEAALPWKGPLVAQAVVQLFRDVAWPALDILLVDLPPGTGDVPLTILEQIPVSGAVVVTTPQRLATVDAERAIALFHEHAIPVFGVVQNMGEWVCPCCGERQPLFGTDETAPLARQRHVADLGMIPAELAAAKAADEGVPLLEAKPDSLAVAAFQALAQHVLTALAREGCARRLWTAEQADTHQAFWKNLLDG